MTTSSLAKKSTLIRLTSVLALAALAVALTLLLLSGAAPAAAQTPSTDTDLTSITVNGNTVPGFDADISSVHYGVAHNIEQVTIAGTPADTNATVSYGGTDADDTVDGFQKNLRAGGNRVTITVTAEDTTTTESWTLHVNRGVATLRGWKASEDFDTLLAAGTSNLQGIWSDGTTMWVSDSDDDKIYAFSMATKARDAGKDFDTLKDAGNTNPSGIWSDGTTMWVMEDDNDEKIYAYDMATKARDSGKDFNTLEDAGVDFPVGIWSDGATMWVAEYIDKKLYAFNMATKARDADKDFDTLDEDNGWPFGIWSDGATMWVSDLLDIKIYAYNMGTQARDATKDFDNLGATGSLLAGPIWSDGTTMWVADPSVDKIYSYVHRVLSADTSLSVSVDGTGLATFESGSASHRHFVESDVTEITVAATATDDDASVAITSPADADDTEDGHQVSIGEGATTVTFTVTAEDGSTGDFTLSIIKPSTAYFDWKQSEDFETVTGAGNEFPQGIWSDGTTMWVVERSSDDNIYAFNMETKARDDGKDFKTLEEVLNFSPTGIWSDGETMWMVNALSSNPKIFAYNLAAKTRDAAKDFDTLRAAGNTNPHYIWSDGATMWVTDTNHDKLFAYDLSTKARDPGKDFNTLSDAGNGFPTGIWSDGRTMWVADYIDNKVYAYNMETKERDPGKDFNTLEAAGNETPQGIWSDGVTLWVADEDDDKLYSYNLSRDEALDLKFLNVNEDPDFNIPGFDPDITEYEHTGPSQLYAEIRALTKDPDAHLSYDRPNAVPNALVIDPIHYIHYTALNEGENVLNITVTADGNPTYKQYTLTLPTIDDVPNEWGTTSWVIPAPMGARAPRTRGAISEAGDIDWINVFMKPDQLYEVVLKGAAYGNSDRTLTMPFLGGIVSAENLPGGQDPDTGASLPRILTHTSYEDTWDIGTRSVSGLDGWARTLFRHSEGEGAPQVFQVVVAGAFPENVGTYDVQVREVEDDHYPNWIETGSTISFPTDNSLAHYPSAAVTGRFNYEFDDDWFQASGLEVGRRYVIEARHGVGDEPRRGRLYLFVEVYDAEGEPVEIEHDLGRKIFTPQSAQDYYIRVYTLTRWDRSRYTLYLHPTLLSLTGNLLVGDSLSVDPTDIYDPDGTERVRRNDSWRYTWRRTDASGDMERIRGARGSSYQLTDDDDGHTITARVCYKADGSIRVYDCRDYSHSQPVRGAITVPSDWDRVPSGLEAGDQFRLLMVSEDKRTATATDIAVYNTWAQGQVTGGHEDIQDYADHFAVLGSTSAISARVNTDTEFTGDDEGIPIYWLGGQKAADHYKDFYDGTWDRSNPGTVSDGNSITFDDADYIWTGSNSSGYERTVNDIHFGLGNSTATLGLPAIRTGGSTLEHSTSAPTARSRMYILSYPFEVGEATSMQQGNQPATGRPVISGTHNVGDTVTADVTGIADADGLTNVDYAYQWLSGDRELTGETNASYTLAGTDFGQAVAVRVTFADDAGNPETLTSEGIYPIMTARENTPAAGQPTISGAPQVGQTLTADTTGITDADGLDDVTYAYSWSGADDEISGATGNTYTLTAAEQGKAITVRITFTDDAGNEEAITSAATAAVAPAPLTASIHDAPESHDGENSFTFELRFSETPEPDFSYETLRDQALTASGGTVTNALRLDPPGSVRWEITVEPSSDAAVTIVLPVTTDCADQGAICTAEGRMLSAEAALTVAGPTELPPAPENLTHTVNDDGHVVLSWTAPDDDHITGYRIMRRMPQQGENTLLAYEPDTGTTDTTYTDEDVVAGELYVYRVKAINAAGVGPHSNYVNAEW